MEIGLTIFIIGAFIALAVWAAINEVDKWELKQYKKLVYGLELKNIDLQQQLEAKFPKKEVVPVLSITVPTPKPTLSMWVDGKIVSIPIKKPTRKGKKENQGNIAGHPVGTTVSQARKLSKTKRDWKHE